MLKVTSKKYEIEELIQLTNINEKGEEEVKYEFTMQITESELLEIKNILFSLGKEKYSDYIKATAEEKEKLEQEIGENIEKNDERFIDICFKEHKDKFKELAGEYKFEEMIENIRGYFLNFFIKKQISPVNTQITNLVKNINNLQNLK